MKMWSLMCTYKNGDVHRAYYGESLDECLGTEAWLTREHYRTGEELPQMEVIKEEVDETYTM